MNIVIYTKSGCPNCVTDTITMALEAKLICAVDDPTAFWPESHDMTDELKAFEALVRADQCEIDAKVADYMAGRCKHPDEIADAIRNRGNT